MSSNYTITVSAEPSRRRNDLVVLGPAVVLALLYLLEPIPTGDLAAQVFRKDLFERAGFAVWDNFWYGGHHTPAYSVLFPPLAALTDPRVVGAVSLVGATVLFAKLVQERWGRAWLATSWFTVGMALNLLSGRLTFALGVAVGMTAAWAAVRRRTALTVVLGALTVLASPVAGAFIALAGVAVAIAHRRDAAIRRIGTAMVVAPLAAIAFTQAIFPQGGVFPFPWWAFVPAIALMPLCAWVLPDDERVVRLGLWLYAIACAGAFVVPSAMGMNAIRLGTLVAGPVVVAAVGRHRRFAVAMLAVPMLVWQWQAPVRDLLKLRSDASVNQSYYEPMLGFLRTEWAEGEPFRVEIPALANHWEAAYVADEFPIARGWERQLDEKHNALFYEGGQLDFISYGAWLTENGVRFVAVPDLPDAAFDDAGLHEANLIRQGLPYLQRVHRSPDWTVYEVVNGVSLVEGPATLTDLTVDSFSVDVAEASTLLVRVRYSDHFGVADDSTACLEASPEGWTTIHAFDPGPITVVARLDLGEALGGGDDCSG
jgi:hypothetical protein